MKKNKNILSMSLLILFGIINVILGKGASANKIDTSNNQDSEAKSKNIASLDCKDQKKEVVSVKTVDEKEYLFMGCN